VQNVETDIGHYILYDKPMTEEQWIAERTQLLEAKKVTPVLPKTRMYQRNRSEISGLGDCGT
jgi:hypothetical protein